MAPPASKKRKKAVASSRKRNVKVAGDLTAAAPSDSENRRFQEPLLGVTNGTHRVSDSELFELYQTFFGNPSATDVVNDTPVQRYTHLQHLAQNRHSYSPLLVSSVWPSVVRCHEQKLALSSSNTNLAPEVLDFTQLSRLVAGLLSLEYMDGGVTDFSLNFVSENHLEVWEAWCDAIFGFPSMSNTASSAMEWSLRIHCFTIAWSSLSQQYTTPTSVVSRDNISSAQDNRLYYQSQMFTILCKHISTSTLYKYMPHRYREWYLRRQNGVQQKEEIDDTGEGTKQSSPTFIILMIQHVLHLMESDALKLKRQGLRKRTLIDDDDTNEIVSNVYNSDDEPDEENKPDGDGNYYDDGAASLDHNDEILPVESNLELDDEIIAGSSHDAVKEVWLLIHRAMELLCDLLSTPMTASRFCREPIIAYLLAIHWIIRTRNAIGSVTYSIAPDPMLHAQQLLELLSKLMFCFPEVRDEKGGSNLAQSNSMERRSIYHRRAIIFQKMCHRHFPTQLPDIIYAGAGLLCQKPVSNGASTTSYLRQALGALSDGEFNSLMHKMRLVDVIDPENDTIAAGNTYDRAFLVAVLEEYLVVPEDPLEELRTYPLYPTERVLWDFTKVPPGHGGVLEYPVLSIPKLQTRFLTFADYLWRNFELMRLESTYEIRSDLTDVIRRVQPALRCSSTLGNDDSDTNPNGDLKTVFSGWARMALEIQGRLELKSVSKPLLGEMYPSQVVAEVTIDLGPCGDRVRREWDDLGEHDILFLVGIDASRMSSKSAPLLREESKDSNQRVPDEDDRTFPERYGISIVRGCMILQVRDEVGTILNSSSPETHPTGTKRIFLVSLDPTQYSSDLNSALGTDVYNMLNLVVRRNGRVNNFKAVLESIRGLMAGMGSINMVLPNWLQTAVLGHGDPKESTFQSETIKSYAKVTVGVAKPDSFLDYGDTFLNEIHLRMSFADLTDEIIVDGRKTTNIVEGSSRLNYRIRFIEEDSGKVKIEAVSYKFHEDGIGNPVQFTPRQVAAIRSGLSPGLSLIVGPPGTGKTDVAVQIIACLYHTFPTQRTIIITHSNAALNDIFQKVMARGDIEERYLVRLGAGERDLQTDSTHDFTKQGRVAYSLTRRDVLLEKVQLLSESLGLSGRAERGADGSPAYTCETAAYFYRHHVQKRILMFEMDTDEAGLVSTDSNVSSLFPFSQFFKIQDGLPVSLVEANAYFEQISFIFAELAEYRPLEILRSHQQRSDYLILKQARVVAMTCTHAAIARSHLIETGFEYDNVVVEEAGQMLEIESFIPLLLQRGDVSLATTNGSSSSRLKRFCVIGDHNQLPPVIQNISFAKYSHLDQSLFARLIRLGVPYIQLDQQGRCRPDIADLFSWRYTKLSNLNQVMTAKPYRVANAGLVHTMQLINVDDFEGVGETTPTPYFYQNVGEAEYAVALFQYLVLIGHASHSISILTTYNGQKALIDDILSVRCGPGAPLAGLRPLAVSTVDQYQGQQNDIIILSLVRTGSTIGHLRDVRRWIVAVSRARLGLYVLCRLNLFGQREELQPSMGLLMKDRPNILQLVIGERHPTERLVDDTVPEEQVYEVDDVVHMGSIVHQMQENLLSETK